MFGKEDELAALSRMGNPLEELSSKVDFEMFREALEAVCINTAKKSNAGRRPIDAVMMFKISGSQYDTSRLREKLPQSSSYRGTESIKPHQVQDALPD